MNDLGLCTPVDKMQLATQSFIFYTICQHSLIYMSNISSLFPEYGVPMLITRKVRIHRNI